MKIIGKITLVVAFIALVVACSKEKKSTKYMGLNGKIETIKDTIYEADEKFGEAIPGDISSVEINTFDNDGNLVKYASYDADGSIKICLEYVYINGEFTQSTYRNYYNNEKVIHKLIEIINDKAKYETTRGETTTISETITRKSKNKVNHTTSYKDEAAQEDEIWTDNNGNIVERKITKGDEIKFWSKSKFNDKNNEIEQINLSNGNKEITTFHYDEYDEKDNWTKKVVFIDGEAESIITREIKYKR